MASTKKTGLNLVVFMEPGEDDEFKRKGTFCCDREPFYKEMMEFSKKTKKILYSDKFVSITVLRESESPCESAASIYGDSFRGKPVYAKLKLTGNLISDITIVGDDDVLQIFSDIAKRWKKKTPYQSLLNRIDNLTGMTAEKKFDALLRRTFNRGPHDYTEARLNRRLRIEEVECWHECD